MIATGILGFDADAPSLPVPIAARLAPGLTDLAGRVPHFAYPMRISAGRLALVEQDTIDDVRQCVAVLLRTPLGLRPLAPEIGVLDPTFSAGVDPQELAAQLEQQEERAEVSIETAGPDASGRERVSVRVSLSGASAQEVP